MKYKYYILLNLIFSHSVFSLGNANYEINLQNKLNNINTINNEENKIKNKEIINYDNHNKYEDMTASNDEFNVKLSKLVIDKGSESVDLSSDSSVRRYLGKNVGKKEIYEIVNDVSRALSNKGFVTSTVTIVPGNLKEGILRLKVNWGRISRVTVNGNNPAGFNDKSLVAQLLPNAKDKVLNIRDIDQIVENGNNRARVVKVNIIPDTIPDYSVINIDTEGLEYNNYKVSIDNSGSGHSSSTGLYKYSLSANYNNLIFGSDSLSLSANTKHISRNDSASDYYWNSNYSVPIGYSNISIGVSKSSSESEIKTPQQYHDNKSNQLIYNATVTNIMYRSQLSKISSIFELNRRRSMNYFDGMIIDVSSEPYTDYSAGLQFVSSLKGYSLYADLKYNHGSALFNGSKAGFNEELHPVYMERWLSNLSVSKDFSFLGRQVGFNSRVSMQYSNSSLLDIYRMAIGDEYSVRGFRNSNFTGDKGITVSNTLQSLVYSSPVVQVNSTLGGDIGYIKKSEGEADTIIGLAAGVSAQYKNLSSSVTIGVPVSYGQTYYDIDSIVTYFNCTYDF